MRLRSRLFMRFTLRVLVNLLLFNVNHAFVMRWEAEFVVGLYTLWSFVILFEYFGALPVVPQFSSNCVSFC